MSALSYLNPKRNAAYGIAVRIISRTGDPDKIKKEIEPLKSKDKKLYEMVVEELGKYGIRLDS